MVARAPPTVMMVYLHQLYRSGLKNCGTEHTDDWQQDLSLSFHTCMGFVFPDTCQLLPPGSWCLTPTPSWYSPVWWTVWCHPRDFSWRVLEANIDVVGGRYCWQQLEIGSYCTWSHVIGVFKYQTSSRIWDGLRWLEDLETFLMAPQ